MVKYKCVGYARISKKNRNIQGIESDEAKMERSIDHQKEYIRTFCETHPDYELIDIFSDTKSGAMSANRDGFQMALKYLKEGINGCNALIVAKKDRLGRNALEYIRLLWDIQSMNKYIFELNPSFGGDPLCITHNVGLKRNDNLMMNVVADAMDAFAAEAYLTTLSDKAIQLNSHRVYKNNEVYLQGAPKFGYKVVLDPVTKRKKYEIVEAEAETIKLAYKLYVDNDWGYEKIAKYLNSHGYTMRKNHNKQEYQQIFSKDTVMTILHFEGYATGNAVIWNKTNVIRRKQVYKDLLATFPQYKSWTEIPEDDLDEFLATYKDGSLEYNHIIENAYPKIIDNDTWDRYCQKRNERKYIRKKPEDWNNSGWLNGLLYCGCGQKMYGKGTRYTTTKYKTASGEVKSYKTLNVYECSMHQKTTSVKNWGIKCPEGRASISYALDEFVYTFLKQLISGTTVKERIAKSIEQKKKLSDSKGSNSATARIESQRKLIEDYNKQIALLTERKVYGYYDNEEGIGPTIEDFKNEIAEIKEKKELANKAIKHIQFECDHLQKQYDTYEESIKAWEDMVENDKAGFVRSFIEKVELKWHEDKKSWYIYIYLKVFKDATIDGQPVNPILFVVNPRLLRRKYDKDE